LVVLVATAEPVWSGGPMAAELEWAALAAGPRARLWIFVAWA